MLPPQQASSKPNNFSVRLKETQLLARTNINEIWEVINSLPAMRREILGLAGLESDLVPRGVHLNLPAQCTVRCSFVRDNCNLISFVIGTR